MPRPAYPTLPAPTDTQQVAAKAHDAAKAGALREPVPSAHKQLATGREQSDATVPR